MSDKILFWIDAGLWHYFIAKSLQEKFDCEISAIIEINKGKNFFESQNMVQFKNVKFFREYIDIQNKKINLGYLREFEQKYGINLWNVIYSDVIFNEHNKFYKFDSNQILLVIEQMCRFFEKTLDEIDPDFLIIRMTDFAQLQILQKMCKSRGVKILTFGDTRLGYRCMISEETDFVDDIKEMRNFTRFKTKTFEELQNFMKGYSNQQKNYKKKYKTSLQKKIKAALEFLSITDKEYRKYYFNFGRTIQKVSYIEFINIFKKWRRKKFIDENFVRNYDKSELFVYYPLSFQPERSTLILSPFYTNQLEVITNIAKSLPIKYKLYVKEHPLQGTECWRDLSFYKKIIKLPNVELIHPSISNNDLIKKSSLVITVTGTSGLEANVYEKPSIVFADVTFSELDSVYRLKNIEDLPIAIKKSLEKKVDLNKLNQFMGFLEESSFEFDMAKLYIDSDDYFYYGGFLKDLELENEIMIKFYDEHKVEFDKIADEHIKKIKQSKNVKK